MNNVFDSLIIVNLLFLNESPLPKWLNLVYLSHYLYILLRPFSNLFEDFLNIIVLEHCFNRVLLSRGVSNQLLNEILKQL